MTYQELMQEMAKRRREGESMNLRYMGLMQLFSAAALSQDGKTMDSLRNQLQVLLDQMLDNTAELFRLANTTVTGP